MQTFLRDVYIDIGSIVLEPKPINTSIMYKRSKENHNNMSH